MSTKINCTIYNIFYWTIFVLQWQLTTRIQYAYDIHCLQNVTDIINVLNSTALPCAENETESFKNWLDNLTDLAVKTDNHSIRLRTDSSLIIKCVENFVL